MSQTDRSEKLAEHFIPLDGRKFQVETEGKRVQRPTTLQQARLHDFERTIEGPPYSLCE